MWPSVSIPCEPWLWPTHMQNIKAARRQTKMTGEAIGRLEPRRRRRREGGDSGAPAANEFWCILSAKKHAWWAVVPITGAWLGLHITPEGLQDISKPPHGAGAALRPNVSRFEISSGNRRTDSRMRSVNIGLLLLFHGLLAVIFSSELYQILVVVSSSLFLYSWLSASERTVHY